MHGWDSNIFAVLKDMGMESVPGLIADGFQSAEKLQIHQPVWYFFYLFLLAGLVAWIRMYYGNILTQTVQAATNFQATSKMYNSNSQLQRQLDNSLNLIYFLSVPFFLYILEKRMALQPLELTGIWLFLFNMGLLAGLFLIRVVLHNIAGVMFDRISIVREYLYNVFIFNKLLGLAAIPLIFLITYTRGTLQEILFWLTIFVSSGIICMRLIRGLVFSYRKDVSIFYLFLYLCALEISPLVLLYRWLEGIL